MIDKELLNILACPACKGDVKLECEKIEIDWELLQVNYHLLKQGVSCRVFYDI